MTTEASSEAAVRGKQVYLDVCALNRPLDDQNQMRIRLEADAVQLILSHVRERALTLVISLAHRIEVAANPDVAERQHIELLMTDIGTEAVVDPIMARRRAAELLERGLKAADAAHVALAEQAGCDFVTVDDRLLRQLQRAGIRIWVGSPIAYCEKENLQ